MGPQPLVMIPSELNRIRYAVPDLSIRLIKAYVRRLSAHENRAADSMFKFSWKVFTCLTSCVMCQYEVRFATGSCDFPNARSSRQCNHIWQSLSTLRMARWQDGKTYLQDTLKVDMTGKHPRQMRFFARYCNLVSLAQHSQTMHLFLRLTQRMCHARECRLGTCCRIRALLRPCHHGRHTRHPPVVPRIIIYLP